MESILIALALMTIGYTVGSVKIIEQGEQALVQRLGRPQTTLKPGLNFIVPLLDSIVARESTKERTMDIEPKDAFTRDNVSLKVDAVVFWQILDLERAFYNVEDLEDALENLVITTLRSQIGKMDLNETFSSRQSINDALTRDLDRETDHWGVKVKRVEVQKIETSQVILEALEQQRAAEARRVATLEEARGKQEAAIKEAEGRKQAQIAETQAVVESIGLLKQALQNGHVQDDAADKVISKQILQFLITKSYVDANYRLGESANSKIIFMNPKDLTEAVSELIAQDTETLPVNLPVDGKHIKPNNTPKN